MFYNLFQINIGPFSIAFINRELYIYLIDLFALEQHVL